MANIFSARKPRRVVPNFRSFADTAALGELDPISPVTPTQIPIDFEPLAVEWKTEPSVGLAGEIVSAALVAGETQLPVVTEAVQFVLDHPAVSSLAQRSAAATLLARSDAPNRPPSVIPRLRTFIDENSQREIRRRIHDLKAAIRRFGEDPIALTELARAYLVVGNQPQAIRSIRMALYLAPFNRYVLRSAARLFAGCEDAEQAFELLQRNPRTQHDPWLASAGLAMAGVVGKSQHVIKSAARLLNSDVAPLSLAELRAGVGSVELLDGDRKRSRKLLRSSLEAPNDNALAQVEWALSEDRLFDLDVGSFDVSRTYEALALEAFNEQQWKDVVRHCESWFMDMPFASRPVAMGSHVATVVLDDFDSAQVFCQAGLVSSPHDPTLINNYAYALALDGKVDEALTMLDRVDASSVQNAQTRVALGATRGLALYRAGRIDEGRLLYLAAIEAATAQPDQSLRHLALLNFAREETLAGFRLPESVVASIQNLKSDRRLVTITILKEKVLRLIEEAAPKAADGAS